MAYRDRSGFFRRSHPRSSRSGRTLGAVFGVFLLPSAVGLLVINESRTFSTERALIEGAGMVQEAPADRISPLLDGALVHVAGPLSVPGAPLADPDFPAVQAPPGAIQLRRVVQTYQWQETTTGRGGGGSRSYRQVWSDQVISSSSFQQPGSPQNPPPRYQAQHLVAPEARLGPYRLTERLLRMLGGGQPVLLPGDAALTRPGAQLFGNGVYVGQNPDAPQIGDQRLAWEAVRLSDASVIAQQQGAGLVPYDAKSGSGASVYLISPGLLTAKEMIGDAEQANTFGNWIWRVVGAGLMFLSFFLLLRFLLAEPPLPSPSDGDDDGGRALTLRGWAESAGPVPAGAVLTLIAAPTVIAATWLAVRPMIGASVLALGLVIAWLLTRQQAARRAAGRP